MLLIYFMAQRSSASKFAAEYFG